MLYPWRGEFTVGSETSQIAIVTLSSKMDFPKEMIAVWGQMKTENLGIEKVVANMVANPILRYLVVCGKEVRGHRSGDSLLALHKNGVGEDGRIVGAKGAVPYIENLPGEAVARFREQVEIIDMIDVTDKAAILEKAKELAAAKKDIFGEPLIVEFLEKVKGTRMVSLSGKVSLHKDLLVDPYMEVRDMPSEVTG
jgi:tetrahydromethanopterin S-methyltransferase subunit A